MVGVFEQPAPAGLLGTRRDEIVLRVCGGARDGQIVRLTSNKCAVGSAENCTLRLRGAGVRPVHCLILRGAERTVIRSWSPDTRLNGRAFEDAQLLTGDRISIGPVEFDVVAVNESIAQATLPVAPELPIVPVPSKSRRESQSAELTARRAETNAEQTAIQAKLHEELEAFEAQRADWFAEQNTLQAERDAEHRSKLTALDAREQELFARETQLASLPATPATESSREDELQNLQCQLAEVMAQRDELEGQREELSSLQTRTADFQRRIEEERANLQIRHEELDGRRTALESQREEFEQERTQLEAKSAELATTREELERTRAELEAERNETAAARRAIDAESVELQNLREDLARQMAELAEQREQFAQVRSQQTESASDAERLRSEFEAERAHLTGETAALAERLAAAEQAVSEHLLDKETVAARLAELEQHLAERAEHASRSEQELDQRARRIAELEAECATLQAELEATANAPVVDLAQQDKFDALRQSLDEQSQEIERRRADLEQAIQQFHDEREEELARRQDEKVLSEREEARLAEEREKLAYVRHELAEERKSIDILRQVLNKPDTESAPSTGPTSVRELLRDTPQSEHTIEANAATSDVAGVPPLKAEVPLSTVSLLERLGFKPADDEESDDRVLDPASMSGDRERTRPIARPELPPVVPPATPAAAEEHEESIEDYMQKLLQRSRRAGDLPSNYAPTAPKIEAKPPVTENLPTPSPEPSAPVEQPRQARPRPPAPRESATHLNDLRELANLSARGAIANFERQKRRKAVVGSSTLAFCTLALAAGLMLIGRHDTTLFYCGVGGLIFGLFSAAQAFVGSVRLRRLTRQFKLSHASAEVARRPAAEEPSDTPNSSSAEPAQEPDTALPDEAVLQ